MGYLEEMKAALAKLDHWPLEAPWSVEYDRSGDRWRGEVLGRLSNVLLRTASNTNKEVVQALGDLIVAARNLLPQVTHEIATLAASNSGLKIELERAHTLLKRARNAIDVDWPGGAAIVEEIDATIK